MKAVSEAVARWRWRRIEHRRPSLRSGGAGRGASWRPVLKVLRAKDSPEWGPEHKASLKSVICNRQWPQQRLCKAGLVQDNRCQLCFGAVGTLEHRFECPSTMPDGGWPKTPDLSSMAFRALSDRRKEILRNRGLLVIRLPPVA